MLSLIDFYNTFLKIFRTVLLQTSCLETPEITVKLGGGNSTQNNQIYINVGFTKLQNCKAITVFKLSKLNAFFYGTLNVSRLAGSESICGR